MTDYDTEILLRPAAAAERLSISRSKLYRLVAEGRIPTTRVVNSIRIPIKALDAYIEANTTWPEEAQ